MTEVEARFVSCDREHGHGGVHTATIDEEHDPCVYKVSWWPREVTPAHSTAVVPVKRVKV